MSPSLPLTKRQRQILDFFRDYREQHDISPTLEEVAQRFGVNKVTIFGHVSELERKGVLVRAARGVSRGVQIVDLARPETVRILGQIAAGAPIEALEVPEELQLADLIPRDREVFALRVRGESMIDDGIHDGDLVLVEQRSHARDGEVVVAILPGEEATLKRIFREAGGFRLEPSNASMEPIHAPAVEVRGVVLGVIRRF